MLIKIKLSKYFQVEAYEAEVAALKQLLQEELASAQLQKEEAIAAVRQEAESTNAELQKNLRHMQAQQR